MGGFVIDSLFINMKQKKGFITTFSNQQSGRGIKKKNLSLFDSGSQGIYNIHLDHCCSVLLLDSYCDLIIDFHNSFALTNFIFL